MDNSCRWECTSVNVPLNKKGIQEFDTGDIDMPNVLSIHMSSNEIDSTWGLFNSFCDEFNLLIDIAEDEEMPFECLESALVIAESYLKDVTNPLEEQATKKVIQAIKKAIEVKTFVIFSF